MRRSVLLPSLVLATTALGAASLLVPSARASAAPTPCVTTIQTSTIKITPRPVAVLAKGLTRQTTTFRVHDDCAESNEISVAVVYSDGIQDYFGSEGETVAPLGDGDFAVYAYAYFGSAELDNEDVTVWSPQVQVYGSSADGADGPQFRVQRAAQLTTNATPEPVHKKHTLTIRGSLTRADLNTQQNRAYAHQPVALQFRTTKGKYHTISSVVTDAKGKLITKRKATVDGCYRYLFSGTKTTAPVTSGADCVDVK